MHELIWSWNKNAGVPIAICPSEPQQNSCSEMRNQGKLTYIPYPTCLPKIADDIASISSHFCQGNSHTSRPHMSIHGPNRKTEVVPFLGELLPLGLFENWRVVGLGLVALACAPSGTPQIHGIFGEPWGNCRFCWPIFLLTRGILAPWMRQANEKSRAARYVA